MPQLVMRLLGPPQIELDGRLITLPRVKAFALLALLAVTPEAQRRDTLATLLWPELSQSRARAGLRRVLTTLTNRLGHTFFAAHRETIGLAPDADIRVDVTAFRDALAPMERRDASAPPDAATLDQMAAALDLYRGDFLAGFSLRDAPDFDNWQYQTAEALRLEAMQALERLIVTHEAQGALEPATGYARRLLALDPLNEQAHQHLMRLLARRGNRAQALRQYARCTRLLDEELGVAPSADTTALHVRIKTGEIQAPSPDGGRNAEPGRDAVLPVAGASMADEVRSMTVLSLGIIAGTDEAGPFDPRALARQSQSMADFLAQVRSVANETGAAVEHLGSDGGLFLFGLPHISEDDPERALHMAFTLDRAAQSHGLQIAVGIKSGPAYLHHNQTEPQAGVPVVGPLTGQAVKLQRAAAPGQILVDRNSYRRARGAFAMTHHPDTAVGVPIYRALQPLSQSAKARGIAGLHASMIGRDAELAKLVDAYAQVRDGHGQVVFIQGEAGVGKSRLVAELRAALADGQFLWLEGRCLEMSRGAGYWPFREMVRALFDWQFTEQPDRFAARIVAQLYAMVENGVLPPDAPDQIGPVLGNLLSLTFGTAWDTELATMDAPRLRRRTITALAAFFLALTVERPAIMVVEDLHWADDLSLDLLVHLLGDVAERRILLLCVHRPAPDQRVGRLAGVADVKCPGRIHDIHLRDLAPEQSRRLVEELLGAETLATATKAWILARGQGNPFFIEEVVRSLMDAGRIERSAGQWRTSAMAPSGDLSPVDQTGAWDMAISHNVESLIHARVDQLAPNLRKILQVAAVVGCSIPRPLLEHLRALPDAELDEALHELERRGFLYQEQTVPDRIYTFQHVLTQQAVYRMLPSDRCAEFHAQTAHAMETLWHDELDDQIERLAYHYSRSTDHARAADALFRAGVKAQRSYLNRDAVHYYSAALQRLDAPAGQEASAALQAQIAETCYRLGRVHYALGDLAAFEQAIRRAIESSRAAGFEAHRIARFYFWLCEAIYWQEGSGRQIRQAADAGLAQLEEGEESAEAVMLKGHLALCHYQLLEMDSYFRIIDWIARVLPGLPYCEELSPAYNHVIDAAVLRRDNAVAYEFACINEQKARAVDDLVSIAKARHLQARSQSLGGDHAGGVITQAESIELARAAGDSPILMFILSYMAFDCLILGRYQEALAYADQMRDSGVWEASTINVMWHHATKGRVLLGMAAPQQAAEHLRKALALLLSTEESNFHQTAYCLGRALQEAGRTQEALAQLQSAAEQTPPTQSPPPYHIEQKPLLAANLAALDALLDDPGRFAQLCDHLRAHHAGNRGHFQQWQLTPATPDPHHAPAMQSTPPASPWRWVDPMGDSQYRPDGEQSEDGLTIHAADGREIWYCNDTAPRFLRPVTGDWTLQCVCRPGDPRLPAMGGLLLTCDLRNFVRLDWGVCGRDEISFMGCVEGHSDIFGRGRLPAEQMVLRLEWRRGRVRTLCSADGQAWFSVGELTLAAPGPWQAGLFAAGYVDRTVYPGAPVGGGALHFCQIQFHQTK